MREIKFRVWDKNNKEMYDLLGDYNSVWITNILKGVFDDYILMQYTGLKDKNGKEIYEGDIVRWLIPVDEPGEMGIIVFEDSSWYIKRFQQGQFGFSFLHNYVTYIEVIGNIYENGDLLK